MNYGALNWPKQAQNMVILTNKHGDSRLTCSWKSRNPILRVSRSVFLKINQAFLRKWLTNEQHMYIYIYLITVSSKIGSMIKYSTEYLSHKIP
jgi:hypothetical protein